MTIENFEELYKKVKEYYETDGKKELRKNDNVFAFSIENYFENKFQVSFIDNLSIYVLSSVKIKDMCTEIENLFTTKNPQRMYDLIMAILKLEE